VADLEAVLGLLNRVWARSGPDFPGLRAGVPRGARQAGPGADRARDAV